MECRVVPRASHDSRRTLYCEVQQLQFHRAETANELKIRFTLVHINL